MCGAAKENGENSWKKPFFENFKFASELRGKMLIFYILL